MALFMEPAIVTREIYVQPITSGKVMNVRVWKHFDLLHTALTFLRINEIYIFDALNHNSIYMSFPQHIHFIVS